MAINYKTQEKTLSIGPDKGTNKFYAVATTTGTVGLELLTQEIEQTCTVNGADIRAVLYALVEKLPNHLSNGKIVKLGELGSFRINISSEGKNTAKEIDAHAIKKNKIIFTPGKKLKEMQKNLQYKKTQR